MSLASDWTVGILTDHIESVAGADDRADVSSTFMQPFIAYNTKTAWTFSLNAETSCDWENEQWSVPVNVVVSKLLNIQGQAVSFGAGVRYWPKARHRPRGLRRPLHRHVPVPGVRRRDRACEPARPPQHDPK